MNSDPADRIHAGPVFYVRQFERSALHITFTSSRLYQAGNGGSYARQ